MDAKLSLKTTGVRGGDPKYTESTGKVVTFVDTDSNLIIADAFEGQGDTYKRRKESEVQVIMDGKTLFKGTFEELCRELIIANLHK